MIPKDSYLELLNNRTLKNLFLILFGLVSVGLIIVFRFYFRPFLFALILYLALRPTYDFMLKYVRKRGIGAGIMILFLFALVLVPMFFLIMNIIEQIRLLYILIQDEIKAGIIQDIYKSGIVQKTMSFLDINAADMAKKATDLVQNLSGMALSSAQAVIAYPLNFIINFFFLLLMLFFLFKDGDRLESAFYNTLPFPNDLVESVIRRLKEVIRVLLAGNLLIMILQGLVVGLGLFIVGIPVSLLGGGMAAILSLIPVVGTSLVWAPAVLYLVFTESYFQALFLGIWCLGFYLLLENIVKPKVFSKKLNFQPVVLFFLLLGSLRAFGLAGVLIGPLLLTLFYSMWEIYKTLKEYGRHHPEVQENAVIPKD
jgi:predicted PurR-regulated permease PerM